MPSPKDSLVYREESPLQAIMDVTLYPSSLDHSASASQMVTCSSACSSSQAHSLHLARRLSGRDCRLAECQGLRRAPQSDSWPALSEHLYHAPRLSLRQLWGLRSVQALTRRSDLQAP